MKCRLCERVYNGDREHSFIESPFVICKECGNKLIESLFMHQDFNEWLDSFIQMRIQKYIPEYNEYYTIYKKQKCPECNGLGVVNGKVCIRCAWVGTIEQ